MLRNLLSINTILNQILKEDMKQSEITLKQIDGLLDKKLDQKLKPIKKVLDQHSVLLESHIRTLVDLETRLVPMIVDTHEIVKELRDDMRKRVEDLEDRVDDLEPRVSVLETAVKSS